MAVEAAIQAALYEHLKGTTLSMALSIAPEGRSFDAKGKAYLRPTFLPAETSGFGIESDGTDIYAGLYQVDVFWPVDAGVADVLTVADALCARFCRGTRLTAGIFRVRIDQPASVLPALQESALLQIPVRVRWSAYVAAPSA